MELQHVNVKIFVDGPLAVDWSRFIEVFHGWVAAQSMDELLIDVADYSHVPAGPGVVLVGHEADYALDNAGHRPGLLYNRKARVAGSNADRLRQAIHAAASACQRLESELGSKGLKFSRQEFLVSVNDRALAPNTAATFEACKKDLENTLSSLVGGKNFTLKHYDDRRSRFTVGVETVEPFELNRL